MTYDEIKKIRQELRTSKGFGDDKSFLLDLLSEYKCAPREKTYELHDIFIALADKRGWSRRKLNTLIEDLLFDTRKLGDFSDDIDDLLSNFLDGLEGNCLQAARLKGDPADNKELTYYARNGEWWQRDFYSTSQN